MWRKSAAFETLGTAVVLLIAIPAAAHASACEYPDEGNLPLRRALTRVQLLPDTEAWHRARMEEGRSVQYRLDLERTRMLEGRCHWTVEAVVEGEVWRRFYVSPDGRSVVPDSGS